MADRLGLADEVWLICQLRPKGALRIRRLVLDEPIQLDRAVAARTGQAIRHSSEIRFGQDSCVGQKGERRQPELSLLNVAKNVARFVGVSHRVDIVETIFYIARIRAGWFWLPGVHVAKGAHITHSLRGDQEGLRESPWALSKAGLENGDQCVVIADVLPVATLAAELAEAIQELVRRNPGQRSTSRGSLS